MLYLSAITRHVLASLMGTLPYAAATQSTLKKCARSYHGIDHQCLHAGCAGVRYPAPAADPVHCRRYCWRCAAAVLPDTLAASLMSSKG